MTVIQQLLQAEQPFLTDGGFETWLFFHEGLEAPEFAAIVLMDDPEARAIMRRYFERFLAQAQAAQTGFVLDTNTWRGCPSWAEKLNMPKKDLLRLSGEAVRFAHDILDDWRDRLPAIVLNGVIGPSGDAYAKSVLTDPSQALAAHRPQINLLIDAGVDLITGLTMTSIAEAAGVALAAKERLRPVALSFTVETDGRLPSGESLGEAIAVTDSITGRAPIYYMVNCAHPDHFRDALRFGKGWIDRIGGVRANASRLSHAELDDSDTLDEGDPAEFGALHLELAELLPNLRVVGGCCGTDHRHIGCVSAHLHRHDVAA